MKKKYKIPSILIEEQTGTVKQLLEIIEQQQILLKQQAEEIDILKEEITRKYGGCFLIGFQSKPQLECVFR